MIATGCERVAPRFEIMSKRNVPLAQRGCSVLVITKPDNARDFLLQVCPIERQFCLQIFNQSAWRVVDRVTAENEQLFDATFIYVRGELSDVDCFRIARNLTHNE